MKIAIVGIQGLPNQYGGFETLSEYIVKCLGKKHKFVVYCSSVDQKGHPCEFLGAELKYYNITSHGGKGILFDCICLWDAVRSDFDVILVLGFGCGPIMPFLNRNDRSRIVLNFGGLDWKRNKWSRMARLVIKKCEDLLVRNSAVIVGDNKKICDYIRCRYHKESHLIAYGGNQASYQPVTEESKQSYPFLSGRYAFEVARIQSDNNIEMILDAFIMADTIPFVLVGNWSASEWGRQIKAKYEKEKRLVLLEAIYDRVTLDILRSNCYLYVHGHSAGGTNPSLCEAMYLGLPVLVYSNGYNENTTFGHAKYFKDENELVNCIKQIGEDELDTVRNDLKIIANMHYRWEYISEEYEKVFLSVSKR